MRCRLALIKDGVVQNVIVAKEGFALPGYTVVLAPTAAIGDLWDGEQFIPKQVEPEPSKPPTELERIEALEAALLEVILNG